MTTPNPGSPRPHGADDAPEPDAWALPATPAPGPGEDAAETGPGGSRVRIASEGVVPLGPAETAPPVAAAAAVPAPSPRPVPPAPGPVASAPAASTAEERVGDFDDEDDPGDRRRAWFACGGCLLLVLVLLIGIGLAGSALLGGGEDAGSADTVSEEGDEDPDSQDDAGAEPSPSEEPEPEPVSPAPDGAAEVSAVQSPTGNIRCELDGETAGCTVLETRYGDEVEDCGEQPFSIQVGAEDAAADCGSAYGSEAAPTLEYDSSAVNGDLACTSRFDGMTCWNIMTGKGFMVSRSVVETF